MEDPQAYIESGILEQYALGLLTPAERAAVDGMAVVRVSARAPLPVVGMAGTATTTTVHGHGVLLPAAGLVPAAPAPVR